MAYIPPSVGGYGADAWAMAPGGPSYDAATVASGQMINQPQGFNFGQAAIGGATSGIGSILALAPKLIGQRKQRKFEKEMKKIQAQQQHEDYLKQLTSMGYNEGDILHAGEQALPEVKDTLAARGMTNSSVANEDLNQFKYDQERRLDAVRRERTRLKHGYEAAQKIAKLQGKAQKSADTWGMVADIANAVGQAAGMAVMAGSDKKTKKDIKPVEGSALEVVIATPVSEWKYKDDPHNPRIGPMAQDVQATMGDKVAPDGKQIDLVSMNGILMKSVQELEARIKELEAKLNG